MKVLALWKKIQKEDCEELINLYERYKYEGDAANSDDYLRAVKKIVPETFKFTRRPFSFKCKCDDGELKVKIIKAKRYIKLVPEVFWRKVG